MSSTNAVHRTRSRRGRRIAAGALAVGASSILAVGGSRRRPLRTSAPTVEVQCTPTDPPPTDTGDLVISNFPPSEALSGFVIVRLANGTNTVYNGFPLSTDGTGSATSPSVPGTINHDSFTIQAAVFRDTNGNGRWDPDTDDTLFRSTEVTIPANTCENHTLSPK